MNESTPTKGSESRDSYKVWKTAGEIEIVKIENVQCKGNLSKEKAGGK